ncbi:hypothetical protein DUI87_26280 [Hirundo rustica rustica]|uniref:FXYD domain-containing ion transport regulator n=1 Tax=Hirundo rustica rustica TaxID=333673 RepID=A0A3M0J7E0_HIRRU|nr:hypothetical protein DUI87_26280 [Hirundo rustica rustica]
MCCMNLSDHSKSIHENIRQLKESVNKLGEVLLTTEAAIRTKERGWIHASRIKGPVDEPKEWTITSEPGDKKLTLKRGLGDAANPFQYDWCHLRVGGLVVAAVLSVVGIIVLFSECHLCATFVPPLCHLCHLCVTWVTSVPCVPSGGKCKCRSKASAEGRLESLSTEELFLSSAWSRGFERDPAQRPESRLECLANPHVGSRVRTCFCDIEEVTQGLGDNGVMMAPDDHMTLLDPHGSVMTMMDPHDLMTSIDPHDPDGPP